MEAIMKRILVIAALMIVGCTDAQWDHDWNYGKESTVTIYGATGAIKTYTSTGRVEFQQNGTVVYFRDKATGKFVTVSGTFSIETNE